MCRSVDHLALFVEAVLRLQISRLAWSEKIANFLLSTASGSPVWPGLLENWLLHRGGSRCHRCRTVPSISKNSTRFLSRPQSERVITQATLTGLINTLFLIFWVQRTQLRPRKATSGPLVASVVRDKRFRCVRFEHNCFVINGARVRQNHTICTLFFQKLLLLPKGRLALVESLAWNVSVLCVLGEHKLFLRFLLWQVVRCLSWVPFLSIRCKRNQVFL